MLLIPALVAVTCFAQTPEKPRCDAHHQGAVWPGPDARAAGAPVEICTAGLLKYRWKQATVSVEELRKGQASPSSAGKEPSAKTAGATGETKPRG